MNIFFKFVFLFFIGSTLGWVMELFYRRYKHGKWVNPGFLTGPYLPIYGFGLSAMTGIYYIFENINLDLKPIATILLMGICMTIIELAGGLICLKNNIRLWDYRDRWLNYKGIICPLFSIIWTLIGALYYYFIAPYIQESLTWFSNNLLFSYILGMFSGILLLDFIYSTNMLKKIKTFAQANGIEVKYEKLKMTIKEIQTGAKKKYSFLFPFKQTKSLKDYLNQYKEKYYKRNNINNNKNK